MATLTYPMARRTGPVPARDFGADYRRAVGSFVADRRISKGLTQYQLGRILGIRDTAVSAIELGRNSLPPERAEEFADALGVNKKTFAKLLLRYTNPWLYSMLWPAELPHSAIGQIPQRIFDQRVHDHDTSNAAGAHGD